MIDFLRRLRGNDELKRMRAFIPSDARTVIDVGAHIGEFAVLARSLLPHAAIICVEPLPHAAEKLRDRFRDDENVVVHECAAGEREEMLTMHRNMFSPASSLLPSHPRLKRYFPHAALSSNITVRVQKLDDIVLATCERPVVLKIDVQGFEDRVLRGASRILAHADVVIIEVSRVSLYEYQLPADAIRAMLEEADFRFAATAGHIRGLLGGKALQANEIYVRNE